MSWISLEKSGIEMIINHQNHMKIPKGHDNGVFFIWEQVEPVFPVLKLQLKPLLSRLYPFISEIYLSISDSVVLFFLELECVVYFGPCRHAAPWKVLEI